MEILWEVWKSGGIRGIFDDGSGEEMEIGIE